jgi:hypothetical protein
MRDFARRRTSSRFEDRRQRYGKLLLCSGMTAEQNIKHGAEALRTAV